MWVSFFLSWGRFCRSLWLILVCEKVSEFAEENDLREIFERFGRVTRVFLAKDRETGRAKGFAFISFQERSDAAKACEKIDGCKCMQRRPESPYFMLLTSAQMAMVT